MAMPKGKAWPRGLLIAVAAAASVALAACSSEGENGGVGSLEIRLSDLSATPAGLSSLVSESQRYVTGVEAITVTFSRVDVHRSANAGNNDAGWIEVLDASLPEEQRTFDLLLVAGGNFDALGLTDLPAGHYQQVRVIIKDAMVTILGETWPLAVSSGAQTGLKLNRNFTIFDGQETRLTLDFDAEQSVKEESPGSGIYSLDPVIGIVQS